MMIRINYFGHFRIKFNKRSEEVQISKNATLYDLMISLMATYGDAFKIYVFNPSNTGVSDDVLVNINGVPSSQLKGLKTKLNNGDEVTLMPLFSGGG